MNIQKLFSIEGRISRREYALTYGAIWLATLTSGLLRHFFPNIGVMLAMAVVAIVVLALAYCSMVKRYHDLGLSAWWLAGPALAALVGVPLIMLLVKSWMLLLVCYVGALSLWGIGQLCKALFFKGDIGANRFGEPDSGSVRSGLPEKASY